MKVESPWDEGFKDFWSLERVGSLNSLSALSFNLHCVVQKPFVQRCFSLWYGFEFLGVVPLHGFLLLTYYNYIYIICKYYLEIYIYILCCSFVDCFGLQM